MNPANRSATRAKSHLLTPVEAAITASGLTWLVIVAAAVTYWAVWIND